MNRSIPKIAFYGHHKACTTWVQSILLDYCQASGVNSLIAWTPSMFNGDLRMFAEGSLETVLCYTNADYQIVGNATGRVRGFHVIRDPRDMVVSAYYSHLKTHPSNQWPDLLEYRKRLKSMSKEDGLIQTIQDMDALSYDGEDTRVLSAMGDWNYEDPNILELRFEELTTDVLGSWRRILRHLNLLDESPYSLKAAIGYRLNSHKTKMPWWRFIQILDQHDFSRKASGRRKGMEDTASHYRKGQHGDWQNDFSEEVTAAFKLRFPGIVSKLGYEQDENW